MRSEARVLPWLTGLCRNEIRRALGERRGVSLEEAWERFDEELLAVYARIESEPLAEAALERAETRELVNATMAQLPDPSQWDPHYADTVASPVLPYLLGPDLAASPLGPSVQAPVLACADGDTIWSQRGETFTQFVDLSAADGSRTVLPPGNASDPESAAFTSQLDAWAQGQLKPTALTVAGIEALAVESVELDPSGP